MEWTSRYQDVVEINSMGCVFSLSGKIYQITNILYFWNPSDRYLFLISFLFFLFLPFGLFFYSFSDSSFFLSCISLHCFCFLSPPSLLQKCRFCKLMVTLLSSCFSFLIFFFQIYAFFRNLCCQHSSAEATKLILTNCQWYPFFCTELIFTNCRWYRCRMLMLSTTTYRNIQLKLFTMFCIFFLLLLKYPYGSFENKLQFVYFLCIQFCLEIVVSQFLIYSIFLVDQCFF